MNNDVIKMDNLSSKEELKLKSKLSADESTKRALELLNNRKKIVPPVMSEEIRNEILKHQPPELKVWEKTADCIYNLLEKNEHDGIEKWGIAITDYLEAIENVEHNALYLFSPYDILINDIIKKIFEAKGEDYFTMLLRNYNEFASILFKNIRGLYFLRHFTKKLIIERDTLFMEYLFSLTSNNKCFHNTFSEMILDQLRFLKVKCDTFYDDNSLEYKELSMELYEFFLNMSNRYLSGFQKARFDTNCIYSFEIFILSVSGENVFKYHSI